MLANPLQAVNIFDMSITLHVLKFLKVMLFSPSQI